MPKFKKKDALSVDAIQWTGSNPAEILALTSGFTLRKQKKIPPGQAKKSDKGPAEPSPEPDPTVIPEEVAFTNSQVIIRTPTGDLEVNPQDWLIKGDKGEFYAVKPDVFTTQYEATPA